MAEQELMDVKFANGNVLKNVPVGTSKEVILDKAMSAGIITSMDQTPGGKTAGEKLTDFALENIDIPAGVAGSITGAKLAGAYTAGNPYAVIGGSVVGGGIGTFTGETLEDLLQGKEIDLLNATKGSLVSMGIDVGLLAVGKGFLGPVADIIKRNTSLGRSADETAREILSQTPVGQASAGSEESIRATQNILSESGASLSAFQATGERQLTQRIADTGILSQSVGQRNYDRINEIVQEEFDALMSGAGREGIQPSILGEEMFSIIDAGRNSAFAVYEKGMNDVIGRVGKARVNTGQFKRQVERFIKAGQRGGQKQGFTMLNDDTLSFARGVIEDLSRMKNMSASTLVDYEKKLMRDMRKFSDLNSNSYNNEAARELAEMSDLIRMAVQRELKRIDPKAAAEYAAVKKAYGETIEGILPTNLKNMVNNAKGGQYAALGSLAATSGSLDNLNSMLKSLRVSHAEIRKAGGTPPVALEEALAKLQEGYLVQLMPQLRQGGFDIAKFKTLAARFERGKDAEKLKILFGDKAPKVRQLFNLMSEASQNPKGNLGELMFRQKEYGAGTELLRYGPSLLTSSGISSVAGTGAGLAGGAAILTLPVFLAKAAYKPANVNRLLAFEKKNFATRDAMLTAAGNLVADIMIALPEEDQAEIRNYIRREQEKQRDVEAERVSAPISNMVM
jgi:hypothetical protein